MNNYARNRGRMAIYAMAGVYLLFMAYNIFKSLPTSSGNEKIIMIVALIFFVIVGGGMVIMGIYMGYKISKQGPAPIEDSENSEENTADESDETAPKLETEAERDKIEDEIR